MQLIHSTHLSLLRDGGSIYCMYCTSLQCSTYSIYIYRGVQSNGGGARYQTHPWPLHSLQIHTFHSFIIHSTCHLKKNLLKFIGTSRTSQLRTVNSLRPHQVGGCSYLGRGVVGLPTNHLDYRPRLTVCSS